MGTIKLNGVTYPEKKRAVLPGEDGKPQVFELPEDADRELNGFSENPVQNKVIHAAIQDVRQMISSPYKTGEAVADMAALAAIQDPEVNEARYVISEKQRYGWTGSEWTPVSMSEADYTEELGGLMRDVDGIREHTSNLFEPDLVINAYFSGTGKKIILNANTRTAYIPCKPLTKYVVSKAAGARFAVGYTTQIPAENVPVTVTGADYSGSKLSITTGEDAAYLVAWVYSASYDTDITADEMLATVMIQEGAATEEYVPPFSAVDRNLRILLDGFGLLSRGVLANHSDLDDVDGTGGNGYHVLPLASEYDHDPIGPGVRRLLLVLPITETYYVHMIYDLTRGSGYLRDHTNGGGWADWTPMGDYLGALPSDTDLDDVDGSRDGYYTMAYDSVYGHDPIGPGTRRIFRVYRSGSASYYQHHIMDAASGKSLMRYHTSSGYSDWTATGGETQPALTSGAAYQVRFPRTGSAAVNPYTANKKVVTLLHFSDVHESAGCLNTLLEWANRHTDLYDDVLCTGDLVDYYDEETGTDYMAFWRAAKNAEDILVTIGNHDAKNQSGSGSVPGWARKTMTRSRALYQYGMDGWGVTAPDGKTYWYKDYDGSDLRLIGLDTTVAPGGPEDAAQQSWLAAVLAEARTAGKAVVIAQHYPPFEAGEDAEPSPQIPCDFSAANRPVPRNIYLNMPEDYPAIVQDFINAGGEFVCWLAGHAHNDHVAYHRQYPAQAYFVVTSLWNDLRYTDQARIQGTPSFVAANLIGFDTTLKLVKLVRVGAGSNYELRPRDYMTYNYQTGTVVRQASGS